MLLSNIFALFFSFGTAYLIKKVIENDYILQKLVLHNFDYLVELFNHIFILILKLKKNYISNY
jgi:hypothetical protein